MWLKKIALYKVTYYTPPGVITPLSFGEGLGVRLFVERLFVERLYSILRSLCILLAADGAQARGADGGAAGRAVRQAGRCLDTCGTRCGARLRAALAGLRRRA